MKDLLALFAHLLITLAKLLGPGGAKAIVADSILMKQQLLIVEFLHHTLFWNANDLVLRPTLKKVGRNTWSESWRISASITMRAAYIPRLLTLLHQKCLVKRHVTAPTWVDFAGSYIVVVYTSYP